jgi:hypothetical protein
MRIAKQQLEQCTILFATTTKTQTAPKMAVRWLLKHCTAKIQMHGGEAPLFWKAEGKTKKTAKTGAKWDDKKGSSPMRGSNPRLAA